MFRLGIRSSLVAILATLGVCLLASIIAFFYGQYIAKQKYEAPRTEVTSQIILQKITSQYFIVTKTLFLDEEITITAKQDSKWNDILWGQTIKAEGTVRSDIGVDMNELSADEIVVNNTNKTVTINLPKTKVLDSSLFGDLEVETQNGILKTLFQNNKNEDYNLAVQELINQANSKIEQDPELLGQARNDSAKLIELILSDLGYTVEFRE